MLYRGRFRRAERRVTVGSLLRVRHAYYVSPSEQTAVKLDRGAKLVDGELRVSDPWLLM